MADRLAELLRQRALLQEHLAWLDQEIAAASNRVVPAEAPAPVLPVAAPATLPVAAPRPAQAVLSIPSVPAAVPPEASPLGDDILDQYRVPPQSLQTDVRKGCLLYFAGAFVLLFAVVTVLYLAFRN